jgi:hypothetical protein
LPQNYEILITDRSIGRQGPDGAGWPVGFPRRKAWAFAAACRPACSNRIEGQGMKKPKGIEQLKTSVSQMVSIPENEWDIFVQHLSVRTFEKKRIPGQGRRGDSTFLFRRERIGPVFLQHGRRKGV